MEPPDQERVSTIMAIPVTTLTHLSALNQWRTYYFFLRLMRALKQPAATAFLHQPNQYLENHSPIEYIEKGEIGPLEILVDAMNNWH